MQKLIEDLISSGDQKLTLERFEDLANLGETRFIEKKSVRLFGNRAIQNREAIKASLGKEVSAFANYDGGIILIGIDDRTGVIEDGVENVLSHMTFKEWLEDIIFISVSPSINTYAVKVIENKNKFLFAIVVAPSNLAPHQCSTDCVYYGRIDGKSRPLNGLMVRDILNRKNNAELIPKFSFKLDIETRSYISWLTFSIENVSNVCADDVLIKISLDDPTNIMISGYHEGKSFFDNGLAQLYADILYPKINQTFKSIKLRKFDSLKITTYIVARNFPLSKFSHEFILSDEERIVEKLPA